MGVDELLDALAPSLVGATPARPGRAPLVRFDADGTVLVDAAWQPVESAWYRGVASMARAGLGVIVEEVLLDGGEGQRRLARALDAIAVVWVGVRCDPDVAAAREAARPGRIAGMAASQALSVHEGVDYDLIVDTTTATVDQCAHMVLARLRGT